MRPISNRSLVMEMEMGGRIGILITLRTTSRSTTLIARTFTVRMGSTLTIKDKGKEGRIGTNRTGVGKLGLTNLLGCSDGR